jgi:hypothetical protein
MKTSTFYLGKGFGKTIVLYRDKGGRRLKWNLWFHVALELNER